MASGDPVEPGEKWLMSAVGDPSNFDPSVPYVEFRNHIEKDGVVIASFASREDAELFRRAKRAEDMAKRIDAQEVGPDEVFRGVPIKWVETDAELEAVSETRMCDLCWQRKPWGPHLINFCDDCVKRNLDAFSR